MFKAVLVALLALVLYGVFPGTALAVILLLFVGVRFTALAAEALRKPMTPEAWEAMLGELTRQYEQRTPESSPDIRTEATGEPRLSARERAQAQVDRASHRYLPPRRRRELAAEALGVIAFAILIPLDIALYTRDFFSLHLGQDWEGAAVAVLCLALYAWPHRWLKSPGLSEVRICWWAIPFALGLFGLDHAVETRHRYLNPFNPDHNRLAAERVLSLKNVIVAGRHADWVLRYARQLDLQGDSREAIHYYREGLRLDPNNRVAYARLASLEGGASVDSAERGGKTGAIAPYWTADNPMTPPPRHRIDPQLESVPGCTVVIVAAGKASEELLDSVGYVIHQELELPVYISPDSVPLPPPTRVRGLVTGSQWDPAAILQVFTNAPHSFPRAPIKYLILTPADLYLDDANYVFSVTYQWGAMVSSARFGGPNTDGSLLRQRTAKQALCALLKSFNVPPSTDRSCVTSYTRTLEEFDAKGSHPNVETLRLFRQAVADLNSTWQKNRTRSRASP